MPRIHWYTLIADENGTIDQARLKSFAAVIMGLVGAAVAVAAAVLELVWQKDLPDGAVNTMLYALVIPLTGGVLISGYNRGKVMVEERRARASQMLPMPATPPETPIPPPPEVEELPPR